VLIPYINNRKVQPQGWTTSAGVQVFFLDFPESKLLTGKGKGRVFIIIIDHLAESAQFTSAVISASTTDCSLVNKLWYEFKNLVYDLGHRQTSGPG